MQNFMKTIISAVQTWTKGEIKDSTADWNENDSSADSYVKNRTHWEETVAEALLPETTLEFTETGYSGSKNVGDLNLVYDESYYVTWDGKEYLCTCYGFSGEAIGDNSILTGGTTDDYATEAPFFIWGNGMVLAKEIGTHTFKIENKETVVHKIDEKYLPKLASTPDWNQNDPDGDGYIENRPFYNTLTQDVIFDGTIESVDGSYTYSFPSPVTINEGASYNVIIDGSEYSATAYFDDTDCCDCISVYFTDGYLFCSEMYIYINIPDGTHALYIEGSEMIENVVSMDKKFLPPEAIVTEKQNLNDTAKAQARQNIGAIAVSDVSKNFYWHGYTTSKNGTIYVTLDNPTGFELIDGVRVCVRGIAGWDDPYINIVNMRVSGTEEKHVILPDGSAINSISHSSRLWHRNCSFAEFVYAGNVWVFTPHFAADTMGGYGLVTLSDSINNSSSTDAATSSAVKEAYDKAVEALDAANSWIITSSTEGSTKKFQITVDDTGTLTVTEIIE